MKLLKNIIENKLKRFDEDELNDTVNFWNFYQARCLAGKFDIARRQMRNILWLATINGDEKSKLILKSLVDKDRTEIYVLLTELSLDEGKQSQVGNFWTKGRFAVAEYEYN